MIELDSTANSRLLVGASVNQISSLLRAINLPEAAATARNRFIAGNLLDMVSSSSDLVELGFDLDAVRARLLLASLQEWKSNGIPDNLLARSRAIERVPLSTLTIDELAMSLTNINLPDVAESVRKNNIGGNLLSFVTDENDLEELELRLSSSLRRRLLTQELTSWKNDGVPWELTIMPPAMKPAAAPVPLAPSTSLVTRRDFSEEILRQPQVVVVPQSSKFIVSASYDHTLKLWPTANFGVGAAAGSSDSITSIRTENTYIINCIQVLPLDLFFISESTTRSTVSSSTPTVPAAAVAVIIAGCDCGAIRIWQSDSPAECKLTVSQAHKGGVLSLAKILTPTSRHHFEHIPVPVEGSGNDSDKYHDYYARQQVFLATGGGNCQIKVWSLSQGDARRTTSQQTWSSEDSSFAAPSSAAAAAAAAAGATGVDEFEFLLTCCLTIDPEAPALNKSNFGIHAVIGLDAGVYNTGKSYLAFSCNHGRDACIVVWDISLAFHTAAAAAATGAFSSSSSNITASSTDKSLPSSNTNTVPLPAAAEVTSTEGDGPVSVLRGHENTIFSLCQPFLGGNQEHGGGAGSVLSGSDRGQELQNHESVSGSNRGRELQNLLVSASGDRSIRIWDLRTCTCVHVLYGHTDGVNSVISLPSSLAPVDIAVYQRSASKGDDNHNPFRGSSCNLPPQQHLLSSSMKTQLSSSPSSSSSAAAAAADVSSRSFGSLDIGHQKQEKRGQDRGLGRGESSRKESLVLASGSWDNSFRIWVVYLTILPSAYSSSSPSSSSYDDPTNHTETAAATAAKDSPSPTSTGSSVCVGNGDSLCVRVLSSTHSDSVNCLALSEDYSSAASPSGGLLEGRQAEYYLIAGSGDMTLSVWNVRDLLKADNNNNSNSNNNNCEESKSKFKSDRDGGAFSPSTVAVVPAVKPVRVLKGHSNSIRRVAVI